MTLSLERRGDGTFKPGEMPQELKEAIGKGQQERWQRITEQEVEVREWKQRCSQCRELKQVKLDDRTNSDFSIRRRNNKSGFVRVYPASECKECNRKKAAKWREEKRQSGELKKMQEKWNGSRDPEARRAYQREYGAIQRRQEGATPRGPWKKYRARSHEVTRVDATEFLAWYTSIEPGLNPDIEDHKYITKTVTRIRSSKKNQVTIETLDRILVALDRIDLLGVFTQHDPD